MKTYPKQELFEDDKTGKDGLTDESENEVLKKIEKMLNNQYYHVTYIPLQEIDINLTFDWASLEEEEVDQFERNQLF